VGGRKVGAWGEVSGTKDISSVTSKDIDDPEFTLFQAESWGEGIFEYTIASSTEVDLGETSIS
jgi:hypothetical protein